MTGELKKSKNINIQWVKGHTGNDGNHKADRLANIAVEEKIIGYAEVVIKDQA